MLIVFVEVFLSYLPNYYNYIFGGVLYTRGLHYTCYTGRAVLAARAKLYLLRKRSYTLLCGAVLAAGVPVLALHRYTLYFHELKAKVHLKSTSQCISEYNHEQQYTPKSTMQCILKYTPE
jgi:hypothetical protein